MNDKTSGPPNGAAHEHAHGGIFGERTELIFALLSGAFLAVGFAIEKLVESGPDWAPLACYVAAYFFGGFYTLKEAIDNARARKFKIDSLMLVAATGAAILGEFAEGALLLFLFSIGHALENYAMGRAKRAIDALAELAPDTATLLRAGEQVVVPVEELVVGDVVLVRPNERLAADGFVIDGQSAINQAPVTGESIPVDKRPVSDRAIARQNTTAIAAQSQVFAGTINGSGALEIEVTRKASESTLSKVAELVATAETERSPTQRMTDKFERIFVPLVLALAVLLLFAPLVIDEPFSESFYRSMAVLVAASPCALAIATPSAVLSGVARAARGGVLIKGGAALEDLGTLKAMAFDKTGTLTEGEPRITDVIPIGAASEEQLLSVAVAVERLSDHPLAQAVVRDGLDRLEGRLREQGRTTMAVRLGDRDLGVIGLMDTAREGAREALAELRSLGIERMLMISGDHTKVAEAIGREVGLDEARGDLMPQDKVDTIDALSREAKVAMVGDGVNDAPAMAKATVGIAMGAAGSDVALETADVALMADDLRHLPFAVGLSRKSRAIIRQNVYVSLGIVAILVPATIFGLGIGPAVIAHEGSTLLVVFNALRLLGYKDG